MIPVTCPQCGARMQVEGRYAGGTWTCGQCQTRFRVPFYSAGVVPPPPIPTMQPPMPAGSVKTSGKAIASLVLGLMAVFLCCTVFTGLPGALLGHMALSDIRRRRGELTGWGIAIAGLVFSYIGVAFVLFALFAAPIVLPALARAPETARRTSCQNNQKQMGLVFEMFTVGSQGEYFPLLSSEPGRLMMEPGEIYDEYLTDPAVLVCPSNLYAVYVLTTRDPVDIIDDHSYIYLGFVVTNDDEVEAFAEAYYRRLDEGLPFDTDLEVAPGTGSNGGDSLLRLHQDNGQLLADFGGTITAAQWLARIPLLIERPQSHTPEGGNVLYMDGHVEFIEYPGKWPMTEATIATLEELARPILRTRW